VKRWAGQFLNHWDNPTTIIPSARYHSPTAKPTGPRVKPPRVMVRSAVPGRWRRLRNVGCGRCGVGVCDCDRDRCTYPTAALKPSGFLCVFALVNRITRTDLEVHATYHSPTAKPTGPRVKPPRVMVRSAVPWRWRRLRNVGCGRCGVGVCDCDRDRCTYPTVA
jgi:hypothetical protein